MAMPVLLLLIGCSHPAVVCSPATDSAKIQAACDAQQAQIIATGACNSSPDVQHCPALQRLRADCDAKQKAWVAECH